VFQSSINTLPSSGSMDVFPSHTLIDENKPLLLKRRAELSAAFHNHFQCLAIASALECWISTDSGHVMSQHCCISPCQILADSGQACYHCTSSGQMQLHGLQSSGDAGCLALVHEAAHLSSPVKLCCQLSRNFLLPDQCSAHPQAEGHMWHQWVPGFVTE